MATVLDNSNPVVPHAPARPRPLGVLVASWALLVAAGSLLLTHYASAPGCAGRVPQHWPAATSVSRDADRPTLLMFLHPQCPCSRASVEELSRIVARLRERLAVKALLCRPEALNVDVTSTGLWRAAAAIPGVSVMADDGAVEARRFGAETSGVALLYDARGRLVFRGGITSARGHSGDNLGQQAVMEWVERGYSPRDQAPVFGCGLHDEPTDGSAP